ncbi:MAG: GGDEF domain-containing protein [Pseudorhizobium sp.]
MALVEMQTMLSMVQLMEDADVLIGVFDEGDRLRFANGAFRAAWSVAPDEMPLWSDMMRRNYLAGRGTIISSGDFDTWLRSTLGRRGKTGFRAFETDLHDGRWLWMTETTHQNGWMLCVASDITAIRADERALRQDRDNAIRVAQTDDLTGIASRRFVMERLRTLMNTAGEPSAEVGCVAVLDIDNFKYINDRFGHATGDAVLKDFVVTLQRLVRKTDILGRVGGEEFILILPHTSLVDAEAVIDRMLAAVRRSRPLPQEVSFRYSFSAGLAGARQGDEPDEVYRRADLALYAAKMRGRDQIAVELPPSPRFMQDPG